MSQSKDLQPLNKNEHLKAKYKNEQENSHYDAFSRTP